MTDTPDDPESTPADATHCEWCNEPIPPRETRRGSARRYCSRRCKKAAGRARAAERPCTGALAQLAEDHLSEVGDTLTVERVYQPIGNPDDAPWRVTLSSEDGPIVGDGDSVDAAVDAAREALG